MGYRAILFDVGDTLWHSEDAPPAAEFRRIAAERAAVFLTNLGVRDLEAATVARTAWDALESAMRRARATDLIEPDYPAETRAALAGIGLQLSREQAGDLVEAIYVSGEEGGKAAYADARRTLDAFRERGFKLGIVTNRAFGGARFREDLHAAGLDIGWDATVVSVEVGVLKPHPGIFRTVLDKLELRPVEAVMVGNSLVEDVAGAQALGIRAAWKRCAPDAEGVVPDFVFDDLGELLHWDALRRAAK